MTDIHQFVTVAAVSAVTGGAAMWRWARFGVRHLKERLEFAEGELKRVERTLRKIGMEMDK